MFNVISFPDHVTRISTRISPKISNREIFFFASIFFFPRPRYWISEKFEILSLPFKVGNTVPIILFNPLKSAWTDFVDEDWKSYFPRKQELFNLRAMKWLNKLFDLQEFWRQWNVRVFPLIGVTFSPSCFPFPQIRRWHEKWRDQEILFMSCNNFYWEIWARSLLREKCLFHTN